MKSVKRISQLLSSFQKQLGEVNVYFCAVDAALAEALSQACKNSGPELQLQAWAKKQRYHLQFKSLPDLRQPLGSYGIVFLHESMESFYESVDRYTKDRGVYKQIDPEGDDRRPRGEDTLRGLVRKLNLVNNGAGPMPDYKYESKADTDKREVEFKDTLGHLEALLMDYFRFLRHAAVHANALSSALELYNSHVLQERERIGQHYRVQPSHPSATSVEDLILYSKVLQKVARKICVLARPNIRNEVLPYLQVQFSRYSDPTRRRNAIIGALRTGYLLDLHEAASYADDALAD